MGELILNFLERWGGGGERDQVNKSLPLGITDVYATVHSNSGRGTNSYLTRQTIWYKTVLTASPLFYNICDLVLFFWLCHLNLTPKISSTGFQS